MTRQNFRRKIKKKRRHPLAWILLIIALGTAAFAASNGPHDPPPVGPGNNNGKKPEKDCGKGNPHQDCPDDPTPAPSLNPYPLSKVSVPSRRRAAFVSDYAVGGGHPTFDGARVRDLLGAD